MKSELTLKILPEFDNLSKAISKVTKSLGSDINKTLNDSLAKAKEAYKIQVKANVPKQELKLLEKQIREATRVKLDLDMAEATKKIDGMRYQLLGLYGTFKGLIQKPISVAMEFESSMADVKKVVDFESVQEVKELEKEIWQLTRTIPKAASELTAVVASGGEMGLDKSVLIPFTDLTAKMGVAFSMNMDEAGNSIAALMQKMGLGVEQVRDLGDAINHLGAKSAATPRETVAILGRIGGMAKLLGITGEQAAGLSAAFANMKVPADQAGTAINKMLTVLGGSDVATPKFLNALKKIGMSQKELQKGMSTDAMGTIRKVLKGVEGLSDDEKIGVLKNMFGEEAGPKIAQIVANMGKYDEIMGHIADKSNYTGSMQREFDAVSATTANAGVLLQNSIDEAFNNFGEKFLPILASVARWAADMIGWFNELLDKFPKLATIAGGAVGALFSFKAVGIVWASFIPLLKLLIYPFKSLCIVTKIWGIATAVTTKILNLLRLSTINAALAQIWQNGVMKALTATTLIFGRVAKFALGPLGIIFMGLGFVAWRLYENWDRVAPKLIAIWEWVKNAVAPIFEWLGEKLSFLGDCFSGVFDGIKSVGGFLGGAVDSALDFLGFGNKAVVTPAQNNLNYNGLSDEVAKQMQSVQNNKNSQIYDNKTINITTLASAQEVAQAVSANSYSYAD